MSKNKKKNTNQQLTPLSAEAYLKSGRTRKLPIYKCLITKTWKEGGLASILIARKHVNDNLTWAFLLVDIFCLGVKDATYRFNDDTKSMDNFEERLKGTPAELIECDYALAHNIIYSALAFAEEHGFAPHKDFAIAQYILEEDTDAIELIEIECGVEGRPFLM